MDRFIIRKRTSEDDGNNEKCTKIQNKSNNYLFFIFIIYIILSIIISFYNLLLFVFNFESYKIINITN